MSDSVRPHRRQPTRCPRPWDSPGKNTGVGCHFLLQCMKVKVKVKSLSSVQLLATPWTAAYQAPASMGFSRQDTGVGCHFLLQCMKVKSESEDAQSCPTLRHPWTAAYQAPLSMGFSRQEYWSGVPVPSPMDMYRGYLKTKVSAALPN